LTAADDEVEESCAQSEDDDHEDYYYGEDTSANGFGSGFWGGGGVGVCVGGREDGAYLLGCPVLPHALAYGEVTAFVVDC